MLLGGQPLPLSYSSSGQINAVIPQSLNTGTSYPLLVVNGSVESVPVPLTVTALQPGIYTYNASGSGQGIVEIAGTSSLAGPNGEAPPADGAAAPSTILYTTTATITATIGGVPAPVQFAGLTPTLVALYQVNVAIPANAPTGNAVPLVSRQQIQSPEQPWSQTP